MDPGNKSQSQKQGPCSLGESREICVEEDGMGHDWERERKRKRERQRARIKCSIL